MKRFLKILFLLMVGLVLLASGVNAALDRLSHSSGQNSFILYSDKGETVAAYCGDLALCRSYARPSPLPATRFIHRTSVTEKPVAASANSGWF